jgi:hypothetical protein
MAAALQASVKRVKLLWPEMQNVMARLVCDQKENKEETNRIEISANSRIVVTKIEID